LELVLKGRDGRIPQAVKEMAEHKLAKLERIDPRVVRVEVELREEHNPRVDGHHKVKVVAKTARRSFRASGAGPDTSAAIDQVVDRLDRQLTRYRSRFRARLLAGAGRLKFRRRRLDPEGVEPSE
jgi:ribosomal subunit interface protein